MKSKILIITSEFPPLPGGIGNHAFLLANYLQKNGYGVSVLSDYRSEQADLEFDKKQQVKVYRIKRNPFTYLHRIQKAFSLIRTHEVLLASGKFSLWVGGLLSCFYPNKKRLAVLHGTELKAGGTGSQWLTKWSLGRFDHLIAVSNFTKNYALQVRPNLHITVINNGIEIEAPEAAPKASDTVLHLVTVGNLTFRKGQHNMIQALPKLQNIHPKLQYHCIGIPTEKERLSALASSLDVADKVVFHGALSETEKNNILSKASVFILLSDVAKHDFEGFGIAILEANRLGIPAVGSEHSGIADAIKDGYSGLLVNPHNAEAIVTAIVAIQEQHALFAENARAWAKRFDWNTVIKQYLQLIEA